MGALRDNHTHSTTLTRAGQCVLSYPWMQAALNGFFAPFYEDLHLSHSINATFDAYRMIDKTGATFYLPAWKAELEVGYNQKGPSISVLSTKGGQQGKQKGMLKILQAAMIEFAPELRPLFRDEVRMFIHFNDFPMTYKRLPNATKLRVPAFAMAGTKQALEVPIPDFTFAEYEKVVRVRAKSSGWPHLAPSILRAGRHSWVSRKDQLFWRGCVQGSLVRSRIFPRLVTASAGELVPGVGLDVADSGWFGRNKQAYTPLEEQCGYKYLLHLDGNTYSASLKYKLACGALVFVVKSGFSEFYYPGLIEGRHYVSIPAPNIWRADARKMNQSVDEMSGGLTPNGEGWTALKDAPSARTMLIRQIQTRLTYHRTEEGDREARRIAARAREFVREQLSPMALACYWYLALMHYLWLYFSERPRQLARSRGAEGPRAQVVSDDVTRRSWLCVRSNLHCASTGPEPAIDEETAGFAVPADFEEAVKLKDGWAR